MSVLKHLVGEKVIKLTHEISRTIPLDSKPLSDILDLFLEITFGSYTLNVYNRHMILNGDLHELISCELTSVDENDLEITLHFGDKKLVIDMTDEGYTGPEALSLYGPDNMIVVWN